MDGKRRLSFATVRQELRKRNLSDQEIETLFAKYDIDQNRELDEDELQAMFEDLEGKKNEIEKEMEHNKSKAPENGIDTVAHGGNRHGNLGIGMDYSKIAKRVDRMEYILTTISTKIDKVMSGQLIQTSATAGNWNCASTTK